MSEYPTTIPNDRDSKVDFIEARVKEIFEAGLDGDPTNLICDTVSHYAEMMQQGLGGILDAEAPFIYAACKALMLGIDKSTPGAKKTGKSVYKTVKSNLAPEKEYLHATDEAQDLGKFPDAVSSFFDHAAALLKEFDALLGEEEKKDGKERPDPE